MALVGKPYTFGQTIKETRERAIALGHHLWCISRDTYLLVPAIGMGNGGLMLGNVCACATGWASGCGYWAEDAEEGPAVAGSWPITPLCDAA